VTGVGEQPKLTSRYTHSRFYDLAAAVQSLPIPLTPSTGREALAATGTHGKTGETRRNSLGPFLGPRRDVCGDFERQAETEAEGSAIPNNAKTPGKTRVFQGSKW
jgi:hypothetical protein